MKIGVCLKQVPASDSRIKIAGPDAGVDTADLKMEINPYDEFALEEALKLKDANLARDREAAPRCRQLGVRCRCRRGAGGAGTKAGPG